MRIYQVSIDATFCDGNNDGHGGYTYHSNEAAAKKEVTGHRKNGDQAHTNVLEIPTPVTRAVLIDALNEHASYPDNG